jgi:hypothetical protein
MDQNAYARNHVYFNQQTDGENHIGQNQNSRQGFYSFRVRMDPEFRSGMALSIGLTPSFSSRLGFQTDGKALKIRHSKIEDHLYSIGWGCT